MHYIYVLLLGPEASPVLRYLAIRPDVIKCFHFFYKKLLRVPFPFLSGTQTGQERSVEMKGLPTDFVAKPSRKTVS